MGMQEKINAWFDREEARYTDELSSQIREMKSVLGPVAHVLGVDQGHREVEAWMRSRFAEARRDAMRDLAEIGEAAWPQVAHGLAQGIIETLRAGMAP